MKWEKRDKFHFRLSRYGTTPEFDTCKWGLKFTKECNDLVCLHRIFKSPIEFGEKIDKDFSFALAMCPKNKGGEKNV